MNQLHDFLTSLFRLGRNRQRIILRIKILKNIKSFHRLIEMVEKDTIMILGTKIFR